MSHLVKFGVAVKLLTLLVEKKKQQPKKKKNNNRVHKFKLGPCPLGPEEIDGLHVPFVQAKLIRY